METTLTTQALRQSTDSPESSVLTDEEKVQRTDAKWRRAAQAYAQLKRESDLLAEKLEAARHALVSLAHHPKESGAGVTVTRYWKQGNVDYKRIPALQGLDLSPWRGKSREEVRVTLG